MATKLEEHTPSHSWLQSLLLFLHCPHCKFHAPIWKFISILTSVWEPYDLTPCRVQRDHIQNPSNNSRPISSQLEYSRSQGKRNIWYLQRLQKQSGASAFHSRSCLKSMHTQVLSQFVPPRFLSGMCLFGPRYTLGFLSFWEIGRRLVLPRSLHYWRFWIRISRIHVVGK